MQLFTIGHSNLPGARFVALLAEAHIDLTNSVAAADATPYPQQL